MMELLRNWITGIACVAVLLSAAQCLMPQGSIRKIGNLTGGLLLLLTIATPLAKLDEAALALALSEYRMAEMGSEALLQIENERLVKEIIAEQTGAYISDKAAELGAECTVDVDYEYREDGSVFPTAVTVSGSLTEEQLAQLQQFIEINLAVPKEKQTYEEVNVQDERS